MEAMISRAMYLRSQLHLAVLFISLSVQIIPPLGANDVASAINEFRDHDLTSLLKSGNDPNGLDDSGLPHLLLAWKLENRNAFEILLEMGADPHQLISGDQQIVTNGSAIRIERSSSILATIVRHGKLRLGFVETSLRYLKLPNQADERGNSIYHQLVCNPGRLSTAIISMMVNSGVDPNCLNKDGLSPARRFAKRLYDDEEELLSTDFVREANTIFLMFGTDLLQPAPDGKTVADDLASLSRKRSAKLSQFNQYLEAHPVIASTLKPYAKNWLLKERHSPAPLLQPMFPNAPFQLREAQSKLPIHSMAFGPDPNFRGTAGFTPLWFIVHYSVGNSLNQLIQDGADPDLRLENDLRKFVSTPVEDGYFGVKGETVLMAACTNPFWRRDFVKPLIAVTKDINQTDQLGRNLLHRLLYHPLLNGQEELVDELVLAGVDVNAQTISGATPGHIAVALNPSVIPVLIKAGADPNARNMHGQTVEDLLRIAIQQGWPRQAAYHKTIEWLESNRK